MANHFYGEASVTLSDGRTLTLRRDFNALAEAEEAVGVRMDVITKALQAGGPVLKFTRALLWGALRAHHPDVTLEDAGELLMAEPEAINAAMERATSNGEARQVGPANPPKRPRRGTGTPSSKPGASRAA